MTELPGKYIVNTSQGDGVLILNTDHTAIQEFTVKGITIEHILSSWKFDNAFLTLTPCVDFRSDSGPSVVQGCS